MCTSMLSSHLSSYIFLSMFFFFFFFIDTPTPEIYTLSLHDALPISIASLAASSIVRPAVMNNYRRHPVGVLVPIVVFGDRKSTRLNSSHRCISYAVFCLKKKKKKKHTQD